MVQDLYILMITAGVVSLLFKLMKQPVVLGYIVAGVLVGPYLFGKSLVSAENVEAWGNVGVLFVLFCIGLEFNPASLLEYWPSILLVCFVIIVGMIVFATLGCWWGGQTMRDAMLTSFSFVQIGEFSFIIAGLGSSLGVTHPALYPIIVASSVVTTFLTPYIMKASVPCYNYLYKHASARLRAKIDKREQLVAQMEQMTGTEENNSAFTEKARHALRYTIITKRLFDLFIKNMDEDKYKE